MSSDRDKNKKPRQRSARAHYDRKPEIDFLEAEESAVDHSFPESIANLLEPKPKPRARRFLFHKHQRRCHPCLAFGFWSLRFLGFFIVGVVIVYLIAMAFNMPIDSNKLFTLAYSISWRWLLVNLCFLTAYAVWESLTR
jgi:hypothetical protein